MFILKKKSCTYVPQINFLIRTKIKKMLNISLRCSLNLNTHPFSHISKLLSPHSQSQSQRASSLLFSVHFSLYISISFVFLFPHRKAQTPALQALHRRLRASTAPLSLTVVGLCSKIQPEIELESPPTQHCRPSTPRSRFESHFHPVNGFWFLFYVFVFRHQSGKPIFA